MVKIKPRIENLGEGTTFPKIEGAGRVSRKGKIHSWLRLRDSLLENCLSTFSLVSHFVTSFVT